MKKRRFPSLRRQAPGADPAGVVFEDLPPDERDSEVVMHPSPRQAEPSPDDAAETKPRPAMPASAVTVHEMSEPGSEPDGLRGDDDYVFRPPADAEPGAGPREESAGSGLTDMEAAIPDVVVDADVRAEVLESTAVSTFVEGPPGSGISTLLVERAVAILRAGSPGADAVTVVTRDQGTAALLRDRLRDALETAAQDEPDDVARRRLGIAVGRLRSMPIGPGAVLAESILRRSPEAAGIAPGFEVVGAPVARLDFESRLRAWLAGPGGDEPAVLTALARGITPTQIHDIAEALTRHVGLAVSSPAHGTARRDLPEPDPAWLVEDSRRLIEELVVLAEHGAGTDDGVVQIRTLKRWLDDAAGLGDEVVGHFLANAPTKVRVTGSRANWDPPETCATQMQRCRELAVLWSDARRDLGRSTLGGLVEALDTFVGEQRRDRCRRGRLYPTDVVPTALALLTGDPPALRAERELHGVVVVDDVWDVDAPTLALVLVLTSLDDRVDEPFELRPGPGRLVAGGAATTAIQRSLGADPRLVARVRDRAMTTLRMQTVFDQVPTLVGWTAAAGRALLAGDPDVQFDAPPAVPAPSPVPEDAAEAGAADVPAQPEDAGALGGDAGQAPEPEPEAGAQPPATPPTGPEPVPADPHSAVATNEIPLPAERAVLTPEGHLMAVPEPAPRDTEAEADAGTELEATSDNGEDAVLDTPAPPPPPDPSEWGAVVAAWSAADSDELSAHRAAEARATAATLRALVDSGAACLRDAGGGTRPAEWDDCAVILGSPAGVDTYLHALESASIPCARPAAGVELLRRQEVQDLLAVLRAALDPDDVTSTVAALRGLAFGCSDTDLVAAIAAAGSPLAPTPVPAEGTPDAVAEGLQVLARLGESRGLPALELVDLALELTRFEEALAQASGADPGLVESVRSLAVLWCGRNASGAEFLDLARAALRPLGSPARLSHPKALAPAGTVEVLTAAEARGRSFPVVVVANMHPPRVPLPVAVADYGTGRLQVRAGNPARGLVTEGFDAALARDDEEYLAQRTRLVCAAFSRARDMLVVAFAASPDDLDPGTEVASRELVRRVARLLAEPDPEDPPGLRARSGVTLVAVDGLVQHPPEPGEAAGEDAAAASGAEPPRAPAGSRHRSISTLGIAPEDPLRAALALALSRADFDTEPVATAPVPPEAIAAACREVGAQDAEAEVAAMLDTLMDTDLWARADDAERVLRRPSVFLDGGPAGSFADRLDLALVAGGTVTGIAFTLTGVDARLGSRVALGTHALALATGMEVGAALVYDARSGDRVQMGPAEVAEAVGTELS